jgi:predicted nucleic acid-binding Zn ribbon protein
MDKYRLVGERKAAASSADDDKYCSDECEVRITQQGKPRNYISYAMNLFVSDFLILWLKFVR